MTHQHWCLMADNSLLMTEKLDEKAAAFNVEDPNLGPGSAQFSPLADSVFCQLQASSDRSLRCPCCFPEEVVPPYREVEQLLADYTCPLWPGCMNSTVPHAPRTKQSRIHPWRKTVLYRLS